jgi:hypothetical protein
MPTDQGPPLHLSGEQMLAKLGSSTHDSIFLPTKTPVLRFSRLDSGLSFCSKDGNFRVPSRNEHPCRDARMPLNEMDLKVAEWCSKVPRNHAQVRPKLSHLGGLGCYRGSGRAYRPSSSSTPLLRHLGARRLSRTTGEHDR